MLCGFCTCPPSHNAGTIPARTAGEGGKPKNESLWLQCLHLQKKSAPQIRPKIGPTPLLCLEQRREASSGVYPVGARVTKDTAESPLQSS